MSDEAIKPRGKSNPITVLCVGFDTEAVAEGIQQEHGAVSVVSEPTAQKALSRLGSDEYIDCIVSTYRLPDSDGLSLLHRVRDEYGELPFVFFAREGSEAVAADAVNADADGYFKWENGDTDQYRRLAGRIDAAVEAYRTRQTQQETRRELLQLAESSDSAVWMFRADWSELIYVNSTYEDIWGRSRATLEEDPSDFLKGIHPDAREKVKDAMETLSGGESVELEYRVNAEEDYQRWVRVQGEPVFDESGNIEYVAGFARDITDRKERQQELKERTRQLRAVLDTVKAPVFMVDTDGRYMLENRRARELFGLEDTDVIGRTIEEVHREEIASQLRKNVQRVLEAEETIEIQREIPTQEGTRTIHSRLTPVYDEDGNIYAITGFGTDITERKQREERLRRQNEEMEVFNSLLRHDVLNGITVIRTRADLLADDLDGQPRQHAETIVEWSDNITDLVQRIRDVLTTLTGEDLEMERVNLSKQLRQQVETVEKSSQAVEFETDVPADVFVQANDLLADVFKNLLTNAVEHNEPEGLRIRTIVEETDETVRVRVADNGRGVPDELKEEIFRRGQTGHVKQTGSGFGLFFADAMVTAYGGDIRVEDNEMGGATFVIELPRKEN